VIRVLLADDQALVRGALAAMLGLEADIEVVAQVGSGAEVVAAAIAHRVDVALLDVQMPGGDGLDAAAELPLSTGAGPLTERERDVLRAAADGATVATVAARLHLSEGTVRNHLSAAIGKTTARTRAEAVRLADEHGWL